MNAPLPPPVLETSERETFNQLKLQMLEAFYHLDVALEDWIHDGGGKAAGASTGCRLKELTETTFPETIATKPQVARFARLSGELDGAIRLRNLIVHSEATFGVMAGRHAIFLSPVDHLMRINGYVAVTYIDAIQSTIDRVNLSAKTLTSWRKQRDAKSSAIQGALVTSDKN